MIREGLAGFAGSAHRGVLLEIGGRHDPGRLLQRQPRQHDGGGPGPGASAGNRPVRWPSWEPWPNWVRTAREIHEQTGRELAAGPVDLLIAVGKNARPLGDRL